MSQLTKRLYTPEEYLAQEPRAAFKSEYDNGEIRALAGASLNHNRIVTNLIAKLKSALRKKSCDVFGSDMRIMVRHSGLYTYPDLSVVCGKIEFAPNRKDTITNPIALIEVLSRETRTYDRGRKFDQYRALKSLQDYLLVDQCRPHVEYFRRLPDNTWELEEVEGPASRLRVQSLDLTLALRTIYNRVDVAPIRLKQSRR